MNRLKGYLRVLFTPACWIQNNDFSREWDKFLTAAMRSAKFEVGCGRTATIAGVTVWTDNHPYASFSPYRHPSVPEVRPRRITILRAHDKLAKDVISPVWEEVELERLYLLTKRGDL